MTNGNHKVPQWCEWCPQTVIKSANVYFLINNLCHNCHWFFFLCWSTNWWINHFSLSSVGLTQFPAFISRMQPKPLRASQALGYKWRNHHPPTLSPKSLFPQPTSPRPAERKPERKLPNPPNLPSLPNPQRCPRPPSPRRCRRSRKEERRKRRKQKTRRRLLNPPASRLSSLMRKTSWVRWTSRKRRRWADGNVCENEVLFLFCGMIICILSFHFIWAILYPFQQKAFQM